MFELVRSNKRRSALLVGGFVVIVVVIGAFIGYIAGFGPWGLAVAIVVSAALAFASYWKSDAVALAVSRAKPADPEAYKRLHNLVEGLCIASGLPKPGVYVIEDPAPNAFATGRNPQHAAIAVTTGLLEKMNRVELEGVLAHELSHIKNYDILVSTLAVTMVGAVALLSDITIRAMWWNGGRVSREGDREDGFNPLVLIGFVLLIVGPIVARIMQATISRRRETLADVSACQLTR
jgi:heat shock protein HtpX